MKVHSGVMNPHWDFAKLIIKLEMTSGSHVILPHPLLRKVCLQLFRTYEQWPYV